MIVQSTDEPIEIDYNALATLKYIAAEGALTGEIKTSGADLAAALDISEQTANRRLKKLWDLGLIYRQAVSDGQFVFVRKEGEQLLENEYEEYRALFEEDRTVDLSGTVVTGLGKGAEFITLSGYQEQFEDRLGYIPFPGTLNVELDRASVRTRDRLRDLEPTVISGWQGEDTSYGPVYAYEGSLELPEEVSYRPVHVVVPERTDHGDDQLEVVAPDKLKEELPLANGDRVTVKVFRT